MRKPLPTLFALSALTAAATPALADINVGVIASLTGPAAALGAETKKALALFPSSLGGEKLNFILMDDATDPTSAVKNARKLMSEDKVDVILGPNLISTAVAIADVANAEKTPMVSVAPLDVSGDKRAAAVANLRKMLPAIFTFAVGCALGALAYYFVGMWTFALPPVVSLLSGWATPDGTLQWAMEDVGRHNALDKLIGRLAQRRLLGTPGFVVMSSRASYELVRECARVGIGTLALFSSGVIFTPRRLNSLLAPLLRWKGIASAAARMFS